MSRGTRACAGLLGAICFACSPAPKTSTPSAPTPTASTPTSPAPSPAPSEVPTRTLRCEDAVESLDAPPASYGAVLDVVAVAKGRLEAHPNNGKLFAKSGLVVRSGAAFTLSVPKGSAFEIGWGHGGEPKQRVVVPGCNGERAWLAFVGGFWTTEPGCLELVVREGERERVVRVGVGAECPAR